MGMTCGNPLMTLPSLSAAKESSSKLSEVFISIPFARIISFPFAMIWVFNRLVLSESKGGGNQDLGTGCRPGILRPSLVSGSVLKDRKRVNILADVVKKTKLGRLRAWVTGMTEEAKLISVMRADNFGEQEDRIRERRVEERRMASYWT